MKQGSLIFAIILAGVVGVSPSSAANDSANGLPTLRRQEQEYASACTPIELAELYRQLVAADVKDTSKAWQAIKTMLCGHDSARHRRFLREIVPKTIYETVEDAGSRPTASKIARYNILVPGLLAGGLAWDATIRRDGDRLMLQYFADEACVKGYTLSHWRGHWLVSEIGQACD